MGKLRNGFTENKERSVADLTEEQMLCYELATKFMLAKEHKQPLVDKWKTYMDAYNSDYWNDADKAEYKSNEVSNFIFSTIETIKPIMVDNNPKIMVMPASPNGMEAADKIQNAFDYEWTREKMSKKLMQGLTTALQIGTAIYMVRWNGKLQNGLGDTEVVLINPFNLYPDSMATTVDDAEMIFYATYRHINVLKSGFPAKANLLDAGAINYLELAPSGADTANVTTQVLTIETYLKDYTMMDVDLLDHEDKNLKERIRKYPNGRITTFCPDLGVILEDKKSPYKDSESVFQLLKCYDVPFEFWGKGEIEQLMSPQTYINDLMNQVIDNAKMVANMPWILDKNCGIPKGQLKNRPGLVIRKTPGSNVGRMEAPQMPSYIREMIDTLKMDIEVISGVHDVTQGRNPGSISAASAIMALQEAAQARIRLKVKQMELSLSELGQKWYKRMQQFWKTDRWVRFTDVQGNVQFTEITKEDLKIDIDFIIIGGSTMPLNKPAMLDLMIRMAQTPAEDGMAMIDREAMLYYTSLPDKNKILERFKIKEAEAKQTQIADAIMQKAQELAQEIVKQQGQQPTSLDDPNAQQMPAGGPTMAPQAEQMLSAPTTPEVGQAPPDQAMPMGAAGIPDDQLKEIVIFLSNDGLSEDQIAQVLQDPQMVEQIIQAIEIQKQQNGSQESVM